LLLKPAARNLTFRKSVRDFAHMPQPPILLDPTEAAQILGRDVTPETICELLADGEVAAVRIQGRDYIVTASLHAYAKRAERRRLRLRKKQEPAVMA
jgi:hypothetical protein